MFWELVAKSRGGALGAAWLRKAVHNSSAASLASTSIVTDNRSIMRLVTASSFSSSAAASYSPLKIHAIPPNLWIDPRSSFISSGNDASDDNEHDSDDDDDSKADRSRKGASDQADDYDDDDDEFYITPESVQYAVPLPERLHVDIHTLFPTHHLHQQSAIAGTLWLDETVFGCDPIRIDLLKRAVDYHRAKKRGRRKAVTKTIHEVSGSGRKLRPQKGRGMARVGHSRPPHFRGGAKAHGPKNVTDYGNTKLNKKVRRLAIKNALSQKLKEGNLILFNQLYEIPTHKTAELIQLLQPWNIGSKEGGASALILDHYYPDEEEVNQAQAASYQGVPLNLWLASSNLHNVRVGNDHACNVYDILKHEKLVLTLAALDELQGRLSDI